MKRSPKHNIKRVPKNWEYIRITYWDLSVGSYFFSFGTGKNHWDILDRNESCFHIKRAKDGLEVYKHPVDLLEMVNKNVKDNMHLIKGE